MLDNGKSLNPHAKERGRRSDAPYWLSHPSLED